MTYLIISLATFTCFLFAAAAASSSSSAGGSDGLKKFCTSITGEHRSISYDVCYRALESEYSPDLRALASYAAAQAARGQLRVLDKFEEWEKDESLGPQVLDKIKACTKIYEEAFHYSYNAQYSEEREEHEGLLKKSLHKIRECEGELDGAPKLRQMLGEDNRENEMLVKLAGVIHDKATNTGI